MYFKIQFKESGRKVLIEQETSRKIWENERASQLGICRKNINRAKGSELGEVLIGVRNSKKPNMSIMM